MIVETLSAISIGKKALEFLEFIKKITDSNVISAYFKWDGTLIEGDKKIEIIKQNDPTLMDIWWFKVKDLEDYAFVRIPVVASCLQEIPGQHVGENHDANIWRWIPFIEERAVLGVNHAGNIKVNFVVVGYRPKALVKHFSSETD